MWLDDLSCCDLECLRRLSTQSHRDRYCITVAFVTVAIDYFSCTSGDGTYGIVVTPNGTAEAEITWHLTHLWFDSFPEDSAFRAEAIAAVWDGENP